MQNRTTIHAAFETGNFKALQLLLVKIESIKTDKTPYPTAAVAYTIYPSSGNSAFNNAYSPYTHLAPYSHTQSANNSHNKESEIIKKIKQKIFQNYLYKKYFSTNKHFAQYIISFIPAYLESQNVLLHKELNQISLQNILACQDNDKNTPLHLACMNGQNEFLNSLKLLDLFEDNLNFYFFQQKNLNNISPMTYIRDKKLKHELLKSLYKSTKIAHAPAVVLELCCATTEKKQAIDWIISICKSAKLQLILLEHWDKNKVFLLVDISEANFRLESEKQKLKLKLLNKFLKKNFANKDEYVNEVEPAFGRHYQQIITTIIKRILDFKLLVDQSIITSLFYLHKPALADQIKRIWNQLDSKWFKISPFVFFF